MKLRLLSFALVGGILSLPLQAAVFPWQNGEQLTYEVYWGMLIAAEGTFTAKQQAEQWQFELNLKSRGILEDIAKIRSDVQSAVKQAPWTSVEFRADRLEGAHEYRYVSQLGEGKKTGKYINLLRDETKSIDLPGPAVEDLVSMLYRLRWQDWKVQNSYDFVVNDRWKVYYGRAKLVGMEKLTRADGKEQNCFLVEAKEIEKGKLIDKYYLRIWISADNNRVPLLARLKFKYGTVVIKPKSATDN